MFEAKRNPLPELDPLIERFADGLRTGDGATISALVAPAGAESLERIQAALKLRRPFDKATATARARIGMQYVAKIRLTGATGDALITARWREENGKWVVCELEDLSTKPSPWSDIPALRSARMEN